MLREQLTLLDSGQVLHSEAGPFVVLLSQAGKCVCVCVCDISQWACAESVREKIPERSQLETAQGKVLLFGGTWGPGNREGENMKVAEDKVNGLGI